MIQKMLLDDFRFRDRFIDLTDLQLGQALQAVNAQFSGVYSLWMFLPPEEGNAKRELCINYLLAWKLAVMYPEQSIATGTGGLPLSSKKTGPIFIKYKETVRQAGSGVLDMLTVNQYGMEALMMMQSAPENYMVFA